VNVWQARLPGSLGSEETAGTDQIDFRMWHQAAYYFKRSLRYSDRRGQLARWNIETTIIVPGAFTSCESLRACGAPADKERVAEYETRCRIRNAGPYKGFADDITKGSTSIVPPEADVCAVAEAIVKVVDTPFGKRRFRVQEDLAQDGAEVVNAVSDRVRAELLRRIGLGDLLTPRDVAVQSHRAA
jgi:hypothetical protein